MDRKQKRELAQLDVYGKMLETYTGDGVFVFKDGSEVGTQLVIRHNQRLIRSV